MEVNQMKKLIISMVSIVMMIGAGASLKSNQDVSVPTVEKSSKETTSVEKKKSKTDDAHHGGRGKHSAECGGANL